MTTAAKTITDAIPVELIERPQWVAWKPERVATGKITKITKIPVRPADGHEASSTDPATWGTYAQAQQRAATIRDGGIGYVFSADDDYTGIDLDGCRDPQTGEIAMWAQEIVNQVDTYFEISPSGEGVHGIAKADKPGNRCKVTKPHVIEVYDRDRYFTMTGDHLDGTPETIESRQDEVEALYRRLFPEVAPKRPAAPRGTISLDDSELIEKAMAARNGPTFAALWGGDTSAHNGDDSAADLALCSHLMFWTGNDKARTDNLFRQSGLYRTKWERPDYREATLEKAMAAEVYTEPRKPAEPAAAKGTAQEPMPIRPVAETGAPDSLPAIDAGNHDLPDVSRQAWAALEAANEPPYLFQHGGVPSRLQKGEDGRIDLVALTEHRLRCEIAQAAGWYITKGKAQHVVAAEPPLSVIQNMLAQAELPLPILRSITETPVFAPDGRLIETVGFDDASGIYVQPVAGLIVPPVPEKPTAADVANARNLVVDDLLGDFPFTEQADRAAAVALFILPYVRAMIPGLTPMHGIESPTVGSGKGLLGDVLVRPAFGQHGGMIAEARDDDEWRKRIGAKLREGAPIIHIDNVTRPLDSGALAMALTAPVFSDRILGQTATFRATVRNVWMFTANNPVMSLEIARRTVRIRIDTNEEKPWQRDTFKHKNLRAWADTHRGELIHAALVLVRAWIVAGKPMADLTLGSYEEWAATVGGILRVAEIDGFLDNLSAFYEGADLEGAAWRQFVALWADKHESAKVGVGDLFILASEVDGLDLGKGGDRSQRVSFGSQLTKQRDRIYDGHRITLAGTSKNAKQWRLLPVKPGGGESRQQRFTPDSAGIATESDERVNLGESFITPRARKKDDNIPLEQVCGKIHLDSPSAEEPLAVQGKSGVNLDSRSSPGPAMPPMARRELEAWARDIASGWGCPPNDLVRARAAARALLALDLPEDASAEMVAKLIVAALPGGPR